MKKQKIIFSLIFLSIIFCSAFLIGCGGPSEEKIKLEQLEKQYKQLEGDKQKAESEKDFWTNLFWMALMLGIVLLLVGTAMGSKARKDAEAIRIKNGNPD